MAKTITATDRGLAEGLKTIENEHAIVYLDSREIGDKTYWTARGFTTRAKRSRFAYRFDTEAKRNKYAQDFVDRVASNKESIKERALLRKAQEQIEAKQIQVGTVYCGSWGYEQTNVSFFKVTEIKGAYMMIQEIGGRQHSQDSCMSGKVMPNADHEIGEPMRKKRATTIGVGQSIRASLWNGQPKFYSTWG